MPRLSETRHNRFGGSVAKQRVNPSPRLESDELQGFGPCSEVRDSRAPGVWEGACGSFGAAHDVCGERKDPEGDDGPLGGLPAPTGG